MRGGVVAAFGLALIALGVFGITQSASAAPAATQFSAVTVTSSPVYIDPTAICWNWSSNATGYAQDGKLYKCVKVKDHAYGKWVLVSTPTPTPTSTKTASPSASPSASVTVSPSVSPSVSASSTPPASASASPSLQPSVSAAPTSTPSASAVSRSGSGDLPVTGSSIGGFLVLFGVAAVLAGIGIVVLVRRRARLQ